MRVLGVGGVWRSRSIKTSLFSPQDALSSIHYGSEQAHDPLTVHLAPPARVPGGHAVWILTISGCVSAGYRPRVSCFGTTLALSRLSVSERSASGIADFRRRLGRLTLAERF